MNVIYNKYNGHIISAISKDQNYNVYYSHYGVDFLDPLISIYKDFTLNPDYYNYIESGEYYILNGEFVKYEDFEIEEKSIYGKILTDDERLLNKLKPTNDEIKKAENTIEILSLLSEVL